MFADKDQAAKPERDPVAPATPGRGDEEGAQPHFAAWLAGAQFSDLDDHFANHRA